MARWYGLQTIFFDWGGTLAGLGREADNWHYCAAKAAEMLLRELSWGTHAAAQVLTERFTQALRVAREDPECREVDTRSILAEWGEQLGLGPPQDWPIDRAFDAFWQAWVGALDPIEGAADALAELRRRGYRLGLVSNTAVPPEYAQRELERLGLAVSLDSCTLSSVVTRRKPHPLIYEAALASIYGRDAQPNLGSVLFVGDGPLHDVAGPQRLGMKTALVRYDGTTWSAEDLRQVEPDVRIDHVAQLLEILPPAAP